MKRERDVESRLRKQIEDMGGLFWKFISPGNNGVPDRIAVFPDGRIVFVELKTARGVVSKTQSYQISRLVTMHQQVCIVRGVTGMRAFLRNMQEHSVESIDYDSDGEEYPLLQE